MNKKEEGSLIFKKYGLLIPFILTIFLEFLKVVGYFNYGWFWVVSPIWIWLGGCFQLFLAAFIHEIQKHIMENK